MNKNLNPEFVTGLTEGDGHFFVGITNNNNNNKNDEWRVNLRYGICAANNPANRQMLEQVQSFFGGIVSIFINISDNTLNYTVFSLQDCLIIRNHFVAYPLFTYKMVHFLAWSAIIDIILTGAHLTRAGLLQIVAYRALFKMGLSIKLTEAFPDFIPVTTFPYTPNLSLMSIHWIAGFINADGSFSVSIEKSINSKLGEICRLRINIVQHGRSLIALQRAAEILGCGSVKPNKDGTYILRVSSLKNINQLIAAFTTNDVQFLGAKALDYADFCKALHIMNNKAHLTQPGLADIRTISSGMNSTRTDFGSK